MNAPVLDSRLNKVATLGIEDRGPWHLEMQRKWDRANALMGGTDAMRLAARTYMPKYEAEDDDDYTRRKDRAVLTPFYKTMLESMVGHVFRKPVVVQKSAIPEEILNNIDRQGNSLNRFARQRFMEMLKYGYCHIIPNYPRKLEAGTEKADIENDVRPYWVAINPENVIDCFVANDDGKETILHVRWYEHSEGRVGFKRIPVKKIRVLEEGSIDTYIQEEQSGGWLYAPGESGPVTAPFVPFKTIYTNRKGNLLSDPPLDGVSHLNVEHWQSSSDQRNILTLSRFAMLAQTGGKEAVGLNAGPHTQLHLSDPNGKFYYVEPEGSGIQAGERDLKRIWEDAQLIGFDLMVKRKGNESATGRLIDASKVTSPLQDMAQALEDGLNDLLKMTAYWLDIKAEKAGTVKINQDYGFLADEQARLDALDKARTKSDITQKTYLTSLQQIGILPEDLDVEKEISETEEEKEMNDGGLGLAGALTAQAQTEQDAQDDDERDS